MITKDDELQIIAFINEMKVMGNIELKEVRLVFQDIVQVGPMYNSFLQQLECDGIIESGKKNDPSIDKIKLSFKKVYEVLNSPTFLRDVPPFINHRGTWDNVRLIVTSLALLHENFITAEDIRLGIDAYTLQSLEGEKKNEYLELTFESIQKALRLMGKAISEIIYKAWVQRMEPFLMCYDRNRLELQFEINRVQEEQQRAILNKVKDDVDKSDKILQHKSSDSWFNVTANIGNKQKEGNEKNQTQRSKSLNSSKVGSTKSIRNNSLKKSESPNKAKGLTAHFAQGLVAQLMSLKNQKSSNIMKKKTVTKQISQVSFSQGQSTGRKVQIQNPSCKSQSLRQQQRMLSFKKAGGTGRESFLCAEPKLETLEQRKQHDAYIFMHEFLYIVCNSQNRVSQIVQNHKADFKSDLYYINQWELDRTSYQQEKNAKSHIHLLKDDFRENKQPAKLISNALNLIAETSRWKYSGAEVERPAPVTSYSLRDMFNTDFTKRINKYDKTMHHQCFEYTEPEDTEIKKKGKQKEQGFLGELKTFKQINYNIMKYKSYELESRKILQEKHKQVVKNKTDGVQEPQPAKVVQDNNSINFEDQYNLESHRKKSKEERTKLYDPKMQLQVSPDVFDFTRAFMYNEELVRHNLNSVKRPENVIIKAPELIKPVKQKEEPNFIRQNKDEIRQVCHINQIRANQIKQQAADREKFQKINMNLTARYSDFTRQSTEQSKMSAAQLSPKYTRGINRANTAPQMWRSRYQTGKKIRRENILSQKSPGIDSSRKKMLYNELQQQISWLQQEYNEDLDVSNKDQMQIQTDSIDYSEVLNNQNENEFMNQSEWIEWHDQQQPFIMSAQHHQINQEQGVAEPHSKMKFQTPEAKIRPSDKQFDSNIQADRQTQDLRACTGFRKDKNNDLQLHDNDKMQQEYYNNIGSQQLDQQLKSEKERLAFLAKRQNTYIDNPYQSSKIQNFMRDSLTIQALDSKINISPSKKISLQQPIQPERFTHTMPNNVLKHDEVTQRGETVLLEECLDKIKEEGQNNDQLKKIKRKLADRRNSKLSLIIDNSEALRSSIVTERDINGKNCETSNIKLEHEGQDRAEILHQSFNVYEEQDNSKSSLIQFLNKVGSIQNLNQNSQTVQRPPQPHMNIRDKLSSQIRAVSTSMTSPFKANQTMLVGAIRSGGPFHEVASNYVPTTPGRSYANNGSQRNLNPLQYLNHLNCEIAPITVSDLHWFNPRFPFKKQSMQQKSNIASRKYTSSDSRYTLNNSNQQLEAMKNFNGTGNRSKPQLIDVMNSLSQQKVGASNHQPNMGRNGMMTVQHSDIMSQLLKADSYFKRGLNVAGQNSVTNTEATSQHKRKRVTSASVLNSNSAKKSRNRKNKSRYDIQSADTMSSQQLESSKLKTVGHFIPNSKVNQQKRPLKNHQRSRDSIQDKANTYPMKQQKRPMTVKLRKKIVAPRSRAKIVEASQSVQIDDITQSPIN